MYVKLMAIVQQEGMPEVTHLIECKSITAKTMVLKSPSDAYKIHVEPERCWSPFSMALGHHQSAEEFEPFGVLFIEIEGLTDEMKYASEIWMEHGIAWIMNTDGQTIEKFVPPMPDHSDR